MCVKNVCKACKALGKCSHLTFCPQFFIMHQDGTALDGQYACFGYVTSGMEIVDEICENAVVIDGNGTVASDSKPVIESIEVVD